MVKLENITKKYDHALAVDSISFEIKKGEVVGFLGPNGAGKTTTLKILTCYMPPTSGTASIAGFDIHENSLRVRENIGYLPESNSLYMEMGVIEYLDFIAQVRNLSKGERRRRIKEVVGVCGLTDVLTKDIGELSKGYRQRVGFAQAIIHNPPVLFMDEPTSGLDPNQIVEIRNLIRELGKEKTVILSTHVLSEVQAACDRVLIINKGRIVADGTKDELQAMVRGKEIIYLKLKAPGKDALKSLAELDGIESVNEKDSESTEVTGYEVRVRQGMDIRETLSRFVTSRKWVILEMSRGVVSLEDIFRKLTVEEKSGPVKEADNE